MTTTEPLRAWTLLYAGAIATSFCYRFPLADELDPHLGDDALWVGMNQVQDGATRLAADRGEITFERWLRAAALTFEAELAQRERLFSPAVRARYQRHLAAIRAELAQLEQPS